MRDGLDAHVQVAARTAARALPALAGHADTRAVAHAGRDLHLDGAAARALADLHGARRAAEDFIEGQLDRRLHVLAGDRSALLLAEDLLEPAVTGAGARGASASPAAPPNPPPKIVRKKSENPPMSSPPKSTV
jgi:hypothetical protein